jgi:hypothetical protein
MIIGNKHCQQAAGAVDQARAVLGPPLRSAAAPGHRRGRVPDAARTLGRLLGPVDEMTLDPARAAQLENLRNAVATGRYRPDLHGIARKLLLEVAAEQAG